MYPPSVLGLNVYPVNFLPLPKTTRAKRTAPYVKIRISSIHPLGSKSPAVGFCGNQLQGVSLTVRTALDLANFAYIKRKVH